MKTYNYTSNCKHLYISGDIHGAFNALIIDIVQRNIRDALIIVAGDCGFGFESREHYNNLYNNQVAKKLEEQNCTIFFVRGNHDNATYFDKELINFPRMKTIPDYSVVYINDRTILCVGGAISVDRTSRKERMEDRKHKQQSELELYWSNEPPVLKKEEISKLRENKIEIDTVITHSAPSFCYPQAKADLHDWLDDDVTLLDDVASEREIMDSLWECLMEDKHPIKDWIYAHFHESKKETIATTTYTLLNIEEMIKI